MTVSVGATASVAKNITEADIALYAAVSLDTNPAHFDDEFASGTPFGRRIAHGMLTSGLISACLGTRLPGPGTIYLSQSLRFRKPVFIGDHITATVEVLAIEDKGRVRLATTCTNQGGDLVVDGEAVVIAPKEDHSD
jgi:3-hydroxybutyryl-CoA dehydratase